MEKKEKFSHIVIPFEKLKLIAQYYEFPIAVFFLSVKELKEMCKKHKTRDNSIQQRLEKLRKIEEILNE